MTDPTEEGLSPAAVATRLAAMFTELEAELRAENRSDINARANILTRHEERLLVADERTQMVADRLAKVVLALMEADAALLDRVAAIEALLPPGMIIAFNPEGEKKRPWFKKLGRASRRD